MRTAPLSKHKRVREIMMNKRVSRLALLGALVATSALATEWRAPWIDQQGPLRYTFDKLHQDKYNLNFWYTMHAKEAHKAFLKHSTKTKPVTELIFNKSDFTLNEIFPGSAVPLDTQNYSPFLNLYRIQPRVNYMEYGLVFGGRWDIPVWGEKGRIGLRMTMPFRRIEMERDDNTDKDEDPMREFVATKVVRVTRNSPAFDINAAGAEVAAGGGGAAPANASDGAMGVI